MRIATIFQSISIIIAAWTAVWGIYSWRKEFIGKRRIDLAEELLAQFYEAKDVISEIRSPFGFSGEGSSREASDKESEEEKEILDRVYVVYERYNVHKELFNNIRSLRYRAMAQLGHEIAEPFDQLNKQVMRIFISARRLSHYWQRQGRTTWENKEAFEEHMEKMHEHEAVFWEGGAEDDPITPLVDDAVNKMETICRNEINKKSLLHMCVNWVSNLKKC